MENQIQSLLSLHFSKNTSPSKKKKSRLMLFRKMNPKMIMKRPKNRQRKKKNQKKLLNLQTPLPGPPPLKSSPRSTNSSTNAISESAKLLSVKCTLNLKNSILSRSILASPKAKLGLLGQVYSLLSPWMRCLMARLWSLPI